MPAAATAGVAPTGTSPAPSAGPPNVTDATAPAPAAQLLPSEIACMVDRLADHGDAAGGARLPDVQSGADDPFAGWGASERERVADTMLACVDVARLTAHQLAGALPLMRSTTDCISGELARNGALGEVLRGQLVGTIDAAAAQARLVIPTGLALGRCASADELTAIANR